MESSSKQHLKNFGEGYTRFKSCADMREHKVVVKRRSLLFEGARLVEELRVEYRLVSSQLRCSYIFRCLEANKGDLGILDYGLSQTTLDQIFVNFAKAQIAED